MSYIEICALALYSIAKEGIVSKPNHITTVIKNDTNLLFFIVYAPQYADSINSFISTAWESVSIEYSIFPDIQTAVITPRLSNM